MLEFWKFFKGQHQQWDTIGLIVLLSLLASGGLYAHFAEADPVGIWFAIGAGIVYIIAITGRWISRSK